MSKLVEHWIYVLFRFLNIYRYLEYYSKFSAVKRALLRNKSIANIHEGENALILLNGPSIKSCLTEIQSSQATKFVTNYFYKSEFSDSIVPDYYVINDRDTFQSSYDRVNAMENIRRYCRDNGTKLIINFIPKKTETFNIGILHTNSRLYPIKSRISSDFCSMNSNFFNVHLYAINLAIFMGFSNIYLYGLDFGIDWVNNLTHNYVNSEVLDNIDLEVKNSGKSFTIGKYWQYSHAHIQAYYMNQYAIRRGVKIINMNSESSINQYEFFN